MKQTLMLLMIILSNLFAQSPNQIKNAIDKAKRAGLSKADVERMAKVKGYSNAEIENVLNKVKGIENKETNEIESVNQSKGEVNDFGESKKQSELVNSSFDSKIDNKEVSEDLKNMSFGFTRDKDFSKSKYFGYDIFYQNPELFQATSVGAVDTDYLIGPGDEIIIMLWGETQFRQVFSVDREGFIFIPEIGQVFVNGLNLKFLETKLFRVFSQSYASLDPSNRQPTTFLDISLGKLRPLRVHVVGEVSQPGAYTVSPSATLFSALYYFNGPTVMGSLRDIHLIRNGKKVASIDFYDYLLTGKKPRDMKLQLDDVIFIPRRMKTVTIKGEINRPGIFELKPDEKLVDLIKYSGGLKISAYLNRAQVDRIIPFEERVNLGVERVILDVELSTILNGENNFIINEGDSIEVFSVLDFRNNIVEINGAVSRPGKYDIGVGLTLGGIIKKSVLLGDAYLNRVDIIRTNQDYTQKLIKVDLNQILLDSTDADIKLEGMDKIIVYSLSEMIEEKVVTIRGNVKNPGRYSLKDSMKVYDLIFMAGGILDEEFVNQTYLDRANIFRLNEDQITRKIINFNLKEIIDSHDSKYNIKLEPNDIVSLYNKSVFVAVKPVTIRGAVKNPGRYELKDNMKIDDLIFESGGLSDNLYDYQIDVARIDTNTTDLNKNAEILKLSDVHFDFNFNDKDIDGNKIKKSQNKPFYLNPFDIVTVRPHPKSSNQKTVTIEGAVWYPGAYSITSANETITDIIKRSGGLRTSAYPLGSSFQRNGVNIQISYEKILKNPKSRLNFTVKDGDVIIIREQPELVFINGEVNSPGAYKFIKGKSLRSYLEDSGGYSPDADKNNVYITYPNGLSKKHSRYSIISSRVYDGSIITVSKLPDTEPVNKTELLRDIASIIGDFTQVIIMVLIAGR